MAVNMCLCMCRLTALLFILFHRLPEHNCKRIIHGRQAFIEEFPFQVSVEMSERHSCGGAILSDVVVITAAHCVEHVDPAAKSIPQGALRVRVGASFANSHDGQLHNISLIRQHPAHSPDPVYADIAVLLLETPIQTNSKIMPILLSSRTPQPGEIAWVIGYGVTKIQNLRQVIPLEVYGEKSARELRVVRLPIVAIEECRRILAKEDAIVTTGMVCAGYRKGHRDACKGDSGGPMVIGNRLVGLTAWGLGCGMEGLPGVYTDISYFLPWIKDTVIDLTRIYQIKMQSAVTQPPVLTIAIN